MQNHLIIGLGGTGGKVIRSFKETIYQMYLISSLNQIFYQLAQYYYLNYRMVISEFMEIGKKTSIGGYFMSRRVHDVCASES